ncbi:uncharacterized protein FTJAE_6718 [Fusarium tjaetaba]|uniref:Uncharacterized protein n=1 Tax=Fusarium tjaetaba TaxID=1567544 RepID=A0A8H5RH24_9HYPO|nr:uncharacterized protein FTJAE_6718 [Fusarium tjaetaba]KAF5634511.1 hypothetical protein FTJAE_6718 [Fusarium tjaetaba]
MVPRKSTSGKSFFKWRNRSTKSASESDVRGHSFASPLTSLSAPLNFQGFEPTQPRPPSSPFVSESAHVLSLQHPSVTRFSDQFPDSSDISPSLNSTDSISPMNNSGINGQTNTPPSSPPSSVGFYVKAKKSLESKLKFKTRKEEPMCSAIPQHVLQCAAMDGTRNYSSMLQITKTGSWFKDDAAKPKLRRRLFGRAPWARKESADSFSSVTSSVREILKGETPPPSAASSYTSCMLKNIYGIWEADADILAVHLNCVNGQFPGGEARRIKTPPLAEDTASGRPRSFFTETVPPTEDDEMGSPSRRNSLQTVRRQSIVADTYEWWEKMPKKPVRRSPFQDRPPFEFQLPEHLPSSPMCPTNEKHVSGGTGVCVYHGRRKGASRMAPV